ncbi:ATP-binding protein [Runella sp.]|uniref:ATP-binding protein n=1 Tax=Runella sp. TaxID=1960881 RepID=UPI003D0A43E2
MRPLPESGTPLQRYWKWHAGDNPAWAKPAFNDQKWASIDPTKNIHNLSELRKAQIGWLRRGLKIHADLVNTPLCFYVIQSGAAEIYLDGKLLDTLGRVSTSAAREITDARPKMISFTLPDTNQHTIAVRLSHTKGHFHYPGSGQEAFSLKVFKSKAIASHVHLTTQRTAGFLYFSIGVFLIFSILHFSFYASNRPKNVSLTLGFTMLAFAIAFFFSSLEDNLQTTSHQQISELITLITSYVGLMLINVSLYQYLHQPFRYFFFLQLISMVVSLVFVIMDIGALYAVPILLPFLLIFIDFIRVSILADRRKDANAKVPIYSLLVAAGCLVLAITFFIIAGTFVGFSEYDNSSFQLLLSVGLLFLLVMLFSIPVGLSFSLVREYSRTQQSLRNKIKEIEALSAKSLAQEQEKQQILAAQNETLERQVAERTAELKESIDHLKTTQDQLIQSEKLASLGELTAGIAHEIQNPLNFVNNFSEVSIELLEELNEIKQEAKDKGQDGELEVELLGDIEQNLQKINHHGKRASSIVKGMLEHSRASSGKKEPTDINTLADEYLRLAYHGLRAKDKSFNADFKIEVDENLPKINVITQDISRVLLNLINNAFYAVQQKTMLHLEGYKPLVIVSIRQITDKKTGNWAEIRVKDNGTGIPEEVQDKIFQPFFTTKPTGQGTGLGLSLAYDIITKGHGGTLDVESTEGEGTEFIVKLPIKE